MRSYASGWVCLLFALPAGGQTPPPALTPPVLAEGVEADYPAQAIAERREAKVVLRLDIDASGKVTEAEVVEPADYGFDQAAAAAALRFRFTPATRNGTPVVARTADLDFL